MTFWINALIYVMIAIAFYAVLLLTAKPESRRK
jgi:hypothetical protein